MSGAVRSNPQATQDGRSSCHRVPTHYGDRIPLVQAEMKPHKPPPVKIPVAARSAVTAEEPSQRVADNTEVKTVAGSWISM